MIGRPGEEELPAFSVSQTVGAVSAPAFGGGKRPSHIISWEENDVVTILDKTGGMSRRQLLKTGAASAVLMVTGTAVICPDQAWGLEATALKPETIATLIKLARDIYPHDQLADRFYAARREGQDTLPPRTKSTSADRGRHCRSRQAGRCRRLSWAWLGRRSRGDPARHRDDALLPGGSRRPRGQPL